MSVSRTPAVLTAAGLAALLAAGSLAVALGRSSPSHPGDRIAAAAFTGFDDCGTLLNYYRTHGGQVVGPYGLPGTALGPVFAEAAAGVLTPGSAGVRPRFAVPGPLAAGSAGQSDGTAAGGSAAGNPGSGTGAAAQDSGTGTNVQVAGVDEADVAKLSGDLLLTVGSPPQLLMRPLTMTNTVPGTTSGDGPGAAGSTAVPPGLRLLRTGAGHATLLATLPTPGWTPQSLLVRGTTVLVIGTAPGAGRTRSLPSLPLLQPRTRIAQVDVTDPARPKLVRTLDVDGSLVGARLADGVARLAVTAAPGDLHLVTPQFVGGGATPDAAPSATVVPAPATAVPVPPPGSPVPGTPGTPASGTATPGTTAPDAGTTGTTAAGTRVSGSGPASGPAPVPTPTTTEQSLAENRRLIAASTLDQWLPGYTLTEGAGPGARTSSGRLLDCTKVAAPADFSGLDTLSLLTFDLKAGTGISTWDGAGVVATGSTVYATADHTYVATQPWQDWSRLAPSARSRAAAQERTWIHAFATDGTAGPRYLASGAVPGFLLNQYALDEYRGDLRVASTVRPSWLADGTTVPAPPTPATGTTSSTTSSAGSGSGGTGSAGTSSAGAAAMPPADAARVTVLRRSGDRLTEVGSVGGFGRGEQIRAVRFLGAVGYVVTFRQTDPLFTVDLSDPTRPRVAGELKLLGYSAYLHPAGDGLLLGVGRAADADGTQRGLALSLFDVSDPAAPKRLAQQVLPDLVSGAESDAHAFTYVDGTVLLPFTRRVVVPMPARPMGGGSLPLTGAAPSLIWPGYGLLADSGVVAVRVNGRTLSDPALLRPRGTTAPDPSGRVTAPQVLRTFVSGGDIWSVTTDGVAAHDATSHRWLAFTPFAGS